MTNPEELDLDAIEARAHAATEGPWRYHPGREAYVESVSTGIRIMCDTCYYPTGVDAENQEFCAHAREDVPALTRAVRERDAEIADLKTQLASIRRHLGGHPDSVLDGSNGLAQATFSAVRIERDRADRADAEIERLRALAEEAWSEAAFAFYSEGLTDGHPLGCPHDHIRFEAYVDECWLESDARAALRQEAPDA